MNGMFAVSTEPGDGDAGAGGGAVPVAVFALIGLILLWAALRLMRRHRSSHRRYTLPRH